MDRKQGGEILTLGHDLATLRQVHVRLPQVNSFSRDDHLLHQITRNKIFNNPFPFPSCKEPVRKLTLI